MYLPLNVSKYIYISEEYYGLEGVLKTKFKNQKHTKTSLQPFARSLGYHAIEAESDSLEVIQLCSREERIWNEATAVYADILEQASQIGKVEFMHCGRDINSVAYELARFCFSSRNFCIWVDEPPSFILDKLLNDVTIL
jgi:hypothetical protein